MRSLKDSVKPLAIVVTAIFLLLVATVKKDQVDGLTFDDGVKAAFFALASAASLTITWIPLSEGRAGKDAHTAARLVPVLSAGLAAWFWLSNETSGNPMPYVSSLAALFGALLAALGVPLFAVFTLGALRDRMAQRNI